MTAGFTGIPFTALDFYEDLEADNSKLWWNEHKESTTVPSRHR
jgi:hypothetical protein